MTEDEKIIKALELCQTIDCTDCPFVMTDCGIRGSDKSVFPRKLIRKVLELHKPVPVEIEGGGYNWFYVCGECHGAINWKDRFCVHCGRKVDWS